MPLMTLDPQRARNWNEFNPYERSGAVMAARVL
jgi:hypothetical protein